MRVGNDVGGNRLGSRHDKLAVQRAGFFARSEAKRFFTYA
jgi:hypothetical protein